MGALTIAFDTTIVGALAASWVALIIHLFFVEDESEIRKAIDWVKDAELTGAAGVLLFAIAFALGAGISRFAADFLNDDDLRLDISGYRFRIGATADGIRTKVYCDHKDLLDLLSDPETARLDKALEKEKDTSPCNNALAWVLPTPHAEADLVPHVFYLQESAIQLDGLDKTERVRQVHDQDFVLRGAALNALIVFALFLFAWSARLRSKLRRLIPIGLLAPSLIALYHHVMDRPIADPPFMEFILFALGVSGICLVWKGPEKENQSKEEGAPKKEEAAKKETARRKLRFGFLLFSLVLAISAFFAWWSTEKMYCELVIDTYYAQARGLPK